MLYRNGSWMGENLDWISFLVEILSNETNFKLEVALGCVSEFPIWVHDNM